jgi:hypothetical protein
VASHFTLVNDNSLVISYGWKKGGQTLAIEVNLAFAARNFNFLYKSEGATKI